MTRDILNYIKEALTNAGLNYAYMQWNDEIKYPYWIGDYDESEPTEEDQCHEYNFRLTGTTRRTWNDLETNKEVIENLFNSLTTMLPNGSAVVFWYAGARLLPTGEDDLKRMQINLKIEEWRVN